MFKTPILFLVFNRPYETSRVFERIRQIKPEHLFIAADGPRPQVFEDRINCEQVKKIVTSIDWPCEIYTRFNEKNLGCGKSVSNAITWFFDHVEEGIILEDDCLPHVSFFSWCSDLLHHYRNESRIFTISGVNFQDGIRRGEGSYYFSAIQHIWGWATWKRAWQTYDFETKNLESFISKKKIEKYFNDQKLQQFWIRNFSSVHSRQLDTWDHQWTFNVWDHGGVSIIPNTNLVSNIGFGDNATHTHGDSVFANSDTFTADIQLRHPDEIRIDHEADLYFYREVDRFFVHEAASNPGAGYRIKNTIVSSIEKFLQEKWLPRIHSKPSNKVLVMKPDAVGDFMIISGLLNEIKKPEEEYFLFANIRLKSLLDKALPSCFKGVIYYDQNIHKQFKTLYPFLFRLRKYKFKKVINMLYSRTRNTDDIVRFTGAPVKIGYRGDMANISLKEKTLTDTWYTELAELDPPSGIIHEFERNKKFLEKYLGFKFNGTRPVFNTGSIKSKKSIVLCPGSNELYKIWSPDNFGTLCNSIHAIFPYLKLLVLCGPGEEKLGKRIASVSRYAEVMNINDIQFLIDEVAASELVIANDSAAIHIAVALGKASICIFNGSRYGRFVPYENMTESRLIIPPYLIDEVKKHPKIFYEKKFSFNINDVTPEMVLSEVQRMIS